MWLAVGQKDLTPKGLDKVFPIKKVYVELAGKSAFSQTFMEYTAVKDTKDLSLYDVTLGQNPKDLKDGNLATVQDHRYIFIPGDNVKAIIGPTPTKYYRK